MYGILFFRTSHCKCSMCMHVELYREPIYAKRADCHRHIGCPNKKETGTNMSISLKFDKHLNILGHYLLEGYLLCPTVPRNVGSVMSVNEQEHFKDRLTI